MAPIGSAERPDPVWTSPEAADACADAWSILDGRPTPGAQRHRRRDRLALWIPLGLFLATLVALMILALVSGDLFAARPPVLPIGVITATRVLALVVAVIPPLVESAARPRGRAPDRSLGLSRDWRRRLVRAIASQAPLPGPWVRVAVAWADLQGLPRAKIVQGAGWLFWCGSYLVEGLRWPALLAICAMASVWLVLTPLAVRHASRARDYRRWLSARPTD